ncbi:hypothetical protein ABNQ39_20650 [Azospirillum sp. A26]|uniref:hypothetical protein n=1 Tax=Azospirillum sp. A26 TaxID=3160607 RepID=UPI00366E606C
MPACLDCGRSAGHFDGCPSAPELGTIARISTRQAYVVIERSNGLEAVEMTDDAGFYAPPPNVGDVLIRLADGTLAHRASSAAPMVHMTTVGYGVPLSDVADHPDNVAICGPAILNDRLDRMTQTLNERTREW